MMMMMTTTTTTTMGVAENAAQYPGLSSKISIDNSLLPHTPHTVYNCSVTFYEVLDNEYNFHLPDVDKFHIPSQTCNCHFGKCTHIKTLHDI